MKQFLINIIKGIIIGIANIIPGLSGATLAVLLGVYEKSIGIITRFDNQLLYLIRNREYKKMSNHISLNFITSITIGIIISFICMANLLELLLTQYEQQTWSYFFGIIAASSPYIAHHISKKGKIELLFFIIGLCISIALLFIYPMKENQNPFFVFLCGAVGGIGMLVPGLSGSYLLVLLGNYKLLLVDTINQISNIINFSNLQKIDFFYYLKIFVVFMLGQFIILLIFSRVIKWLISKYKSVTFSTITGFIIGSLSHIWPWKKIDPTHTRLIDILSYPTFQEKTDFHLVLFMSLGVITIIIIEKLLMQIKNV